MMFRDVSLAHKHLAVVVFAFRFALRVRVHVHGSRSRSQFAFAIRDMIGRGMTWGDVMTNSFTFSHESCWRVTKSVAFLESLQI